MNLNKIVLFHKQTIMQYTFQLVALIGLNPPTDYPAYMCWGVNVCKHAGKSAYMRFYFGLALLMPGKTVL